MVGRVRGFNQGRTLLKPRRETLSKIDYKKRACLQQALFFEEIRARRRSKFRVREVFIVV